MNHYYFWGPEVISEEHCLFPSGLHIIHSLDEVNFIQNLVFYIEAAYKTAVSTYFRMHLKNGFIFNTLSNPYLLIMVNLVIN